MPDGSTPIRLEPCHDIAARHVELLTGDRDRSCCFRLLCSAGTYSNRNLGGRLSDLWSEIEEAQSKGAEVFTVVNEGGHNGREITQVRALFIDCDSGPVPDRWHAEPDFIVRRDANHWHAYWLTADTPLAAFTEAQKRLAAHYGTDRSVCDLPRIMRLAGTIHLKDPKHPRLVTIEADANAALPEFARTHAELMAGLPELPASHRETAAVPTGEPVSLDIVRGHA